MAGFGFVAYPEALPNCQENQAPVHRSDQVGSLCSNLLCRRLNVCSKSDGDVEHNPRMSQK